MKTLKSELGNRLSSAIVNRICPTDKLNAISDRTAISKPTEADTDAFCSLLSSPNCQSLLEIGKYGINVGRGQDIQIGNHIYKVADAETIRKLIQDELQTLHY